MKKVLLGTISVLLLLGLLTGCDTTDSKDEEGNQKNQFAVSETAIVNDTKIKINSIKKVRKECSWEYDGECQSYTEPKNNYFLIIDVTIENTGSDDLNVSSIMSFELKDQNGEKGSEAYLSKSVTSSLGGTVMTGDLLKGQIAYDVKESDEYYFYYLDNLLGSPIKFVIDKSDIIE